jgi:hypothetical protein
MAWLQEHRLQEIGKEIESLTLRSKDLTSVEWKQLEKLVDEGNDLWVAKKTHEAALRLGGTKLMSPAEFGIDANPGDFDNGPTFKGFGPGMENQIRPVSLYELDKTQISALQKAAQQGTPFKVQVGSKGIEHGEWGVRQKSAVTEGGLTPNLLPPTQLSGAGSWYGLPYENTRAANFLPNIAFDTAGIAFWQHSANAAEAAYVAEGAAKPDISPTVKEQYVRPAKCAGRLLMTHELVADAGDGFAQNLVADLARSVYNAENNLILNGTAGGNGFNGINQLSGTITRTIGSDTALDCLSKAFTDLRQAFFEPDLVFINPATLGALRRTKDTQNRYILDMTGPRGIDQTSEVETLWGVNCVQTTQQAAGTAAVLSVKSGAACVYVRESLTTFFDPYSQASSNIYQYIAETRLALASPRPGAVNIVSGLPTS